MEAEDGMKLWQGMTIVALLWAALYLPFLGSNELRGEEARRVLPARTMLQTGDWVVPRIGGEEYASKPPLINWTVAAMFALTGRQNEWTARLPSVLWLLAFALVATRMLARRLGVWRAASAGLFFLCAFGLLDKGRTAEIEAMYSAQTGIAFVLWAVWWAEGKPWRAYLTAAVFLGLGLLAKGPMLLAVFYGAVIPALWLARRKRELIQAPHLIGLLIMAGIFLPWLLLNLHHVRAPESTTGVWVDQVAVRFSFRDIDWGQWAQLPLQIFKDFLPGSMFLVLLWKLPSTNQAWAGSEERERWHCVVEGAKWAVLAGWILLCLSPEFRPRYAMPLFGIAAVVLADLFARLNPGGDLALRIEQSWRRLNRAGLGLVVAGGLGSVVAAAAGWKQLPVGAAWPGLLTAVALGLGWKRLERWAPLATACVILAGAQILVFQFSRSWKDQRGLCRPVARAVQEMIPDDGRSVVFFRPGFLRFLFYLNRPYEEVTRLDGAAAGRPGYLAVREPDLENGAVQEMLRQHQGIELGRMEIEGRKFLFFNLEGAP